MDEIKPPCQGEKLYGFCNGYFGRDSYGEKTVVTGGQYNHEYWVVVEDEWGSKRYLTFASGFSLEDLERWRKPEEVI